MVVGSPIVLNLIPGGVMPVIMINETDKGYQKEFLIYNGNAPFNVPVNISATIRGTKRDGFGVTEAADVTAESNVVRITITEQMTAVPGKNIFELVFVNTSGLRVATINFIMLVERSALNANTVISESDIAYAEQVLTWLQGVAAFKEQLDNASADIIDLKAEKYNTCIDMQASTTLKSGMIVQTAGYYAINDGGAAMYYVIGSAPVDDYYETLQNNLIAILICKNEANLKQFGAKGNGSTDDTAAINAALLYCHKTRNELYAPTGTYIYNGALQYGNLCLHGDGIGRTIFKLKDNCTIPSGRFITGFSVRPNLNDIESVIFRDFEIDGNAANNRHWTNVQYGSWNNLQDQTQCNGIRTEVEDLGGGTSNYAQYIEISGLYIHDTIRDNVILASDGYAVIKNCIFKNSDTDHLLYLQTRSGETYICDCVLKGFANGLIQSSRATIRGIKFKDIQKNPANTSAGVTFITVLDRRNVGQLSGLDISGIEYDEENASDSYRYVLLYSNAEVSLSNVQIDMHGAGKFIMFYTDGNTASGYASEVGLNAENISLRNLSKTSQPVLIDHECNNMIRLRNTDITHTERPTGLGIVTIQTSGNVGGIVLDNVNVSNAWTIIKNLIDISAKTYRAICKNSDIDVPADTYVYDGPAAPIGFLRLENVHVEAFRFNVTSKYVHYDNVHSDDGDIRYLANAPAEGNEVGDIWFKAGALRIWNGTAWISPT